MAFGFKKDFDLLLKQQAVAAAQDSHVVVMTQCLNINNAGLLWIPVGHRRSSIEYNQCIGDVYSLFSIT